MACFRACGASASFLSVQLGAPLWFPICLQVVDRLPTDVHVMCTSLLGRSERASGSKGFWEAHGKDWVYKTSSENDRLLLA